MLCRNPPPGLEAGLGGGWGYIAASCSSCVTCGVIGGPRCCHAPLGPWFYWRSKTVQTWETPMSGLFPQSLPIPDEPGVWSGVPVFRSAVTCVVFAVFVYAIIPTLAKPGCWCWFGAGCCGSGYTLCGLSSVASFGGSSPHDPSRTGGFPTPHHDGPGAGGGTIIIHEHTRVGLVFHCAVPVTAHCPALKTGLAIVPIVPSAVASNVPGA